jgi:hypothetical protein
LKIFYTERAVVQVPGQVRADAGKR